MAELRCYTSIHIDKLTESDVQVECQTSSGSRHYIVIKIAGNYIFLNNYEAAATLFRQLVPGAMLSLALWLSRIRGDKQEVTSAEAVPNS